MKRGLLVAILFLCAASATSWSQAHGPDQLVSSFSFDGMRLFHDLVYAQNGDGYIVQLNETPNSPDSLEVTIFRSQDNGVTWGEWLRESVPHANEEIATEISVQVTEASGAPALIICYAVENSTARVGRSLLYRLDGASVANPVQEMFNGQPLRRNNSQSTSRDVDTDVAHSGTPYVYAIAVTHTDPDQVYVQRFNPAIEAWEFAFPIAAGASGTGGWSFSDLRWPAIDVGVNGDLVAGWAYWNLSQGAETISVCPGTGGATFGPVNWGHVAQATAAYAFRDIVFSNSSDDVLVAMRPISTGGGSIIDTVSVMHSQDKGLTFYSAGIIDFENKHSPQFTDDGQTFALQMDNNPAFFGGPGAPPEADSYTSYTTSSVSAPMQFATLWKFPDRIYFFNEKVKVAFNPTMPSGQNLSSMWLIYSSAIQDSVMFDAQWRTGSFPNMQTSISQPASAIDPAIGNLDGDADLEVVFVDDTGAVHAVNPDGTPLPGWPVSTIGPSNVAVADLNDDGVDEVVWGTYDPGSSKPRQAPGSGGGSASSSQAAESVVHVYSANGTPASGYPVSLGDKGATFVSVGSVLNSDSKQVVAQAQLSLTVLSHGSHLPGFPVTPATGSFVSSAAIGDVDGDGVNEIVSDSRSGFIGTARIYRNDGSVMQTLTSGNNLGFHAPVLADLDLNNDLEILLLQGDNLRVVHHDDTPMFSYVPNGNITNIAVADVRGTAAPEIIISKSAQLFTDHGVHEIDANGNLLWSYVTGTNPGGPVVIQPDGASSVVSAELGTAAHMVPGDDPNASPTPINGWPLNLDCMSSPAAADIDNDGIVEIVFVGATGVNILESLGTATFNGSEIWPMAGYEAGRSNCQNCSTPTTVGVDDDFASSTPTLMSPPSPNPSRAMARIAYQLVGQSKVSLEVFDIQGRRVRTLFEGIQSQGQHEALWDGRDSSGQATSAGIYYLRMKSEHRGETHEEVQKITRVR